MADPDATLAVICPGQGSQSPGIGLPWQAEPVWDLVTEASDATGVDVGHLLTEADADELLDTANAQLSTYVISVVIGTALAETGIVPGHVAGHSLGEYSALTVGGWLPLAQGAELVWARGLGMRAASAERLGTMAAIIGLDPAALTRLCEAEGGVWVANDNAPGQVVIAGDPAAIEAVGVAAKAEGARSPMTLQVAGAFHTPFMSSAREPLAAALEAVTFVGGASTPWANVDASAHLSTVEWPDLLSRQLCSAVRWNDEVAAMVAAGVTTFIEAGPGSVLSGMVKRIAKETTRSSVSTPADAEELAGS